ncbi:Uncharacterised protein [Mycobacteroides abscessus subsp. abscessus]|nr:Uncharacterised protein [Mycobacteroides abscessus subsp. abscessus]
MIWLTNNTISGTVHTQWWVHASGDTTQPTMPTTVMARSSRPVRCARHAAAIPSSAAPPASSTHNHVGIGCGVYTFAKAPPIEELAGWSSEPMWPVVRTAPNQ